MDTYERVALGEYLAEYPADMLYDTIIDMLNIAEYNYPDGIVPAEFYEDWYCPCLADHIDALKETLERNFIER